MEQQYNRKTYLKRGKDLEYQILLTPIANNETFAKVKAIEETVQSANWMLKFCKNKQLIRYNCLVIEAAEEVLMDIKHSTFH